MLHLLLQVPAALLTDEGTWAWGVQVDPTGVAAATLYSGVPDSIALAGCETVSVMSQPG